MKIALKLSNIYFKQTLSQFLQSKKIKSKIGNSLLIIFLFLIVAISMGIAYYGTAEQFSAIGKPEFVLIMGLMFASFMVLIMTAYDGQNQYYKNKDYSLLASMPIKTSSIITAKYLSSYFTSLLYSIIVALPAFIVYFIFCPIDVLAILFSLVALFFLPTFTQLIGNIIAFFINIVTMKVKNRSIINNILTIIFTVLLISFITIANSGLMEELFAQGIPLWIKIVFPHIYFLFDSITTLSGLSFLIFLALSIIYSIIGILIVTIGYKKINSTYISSQRKKKLKLITYQKSNIIVSLLKKETRTFFFSPSYFINCLIGPILVIVLAVSMGISAKQMTINPTQDFPAEYFILMYICFSAMCLGLSSPTSVSISIEGNKFFILRSLPLSSRKIIFSKILFNIILFLPFIFIGDIIFLTIIPSSIDLIIITLFVPIVSMITFSGIGMLCNLKWPKLHWTNENQAIKQGLSLFMTRIIAMALTLIPFLIYMLLSTQINAIFSLSQYFAIYLLFITLIGITIYLILYFKCENLIKKIK